LAPKTVSGDTTANGQRKGVPDCWSGNSEAARTKTCADMSNEQQFRVDVACLSSDISVVPIPVKTIPELVSRAFWVFPETGIAELADRDNLG